MDTPLPDTAVLTALIELFPRIHRAGVVQEVQAERLGQLRSRSVAVLERWYLVGIEGVNECFVEWDERAFLVDKAIHQRLSRRETEN